MSKLSNPMLSIMKFKDDENAFFLFSPFDEVVMAAVLKNISISLEKKSRRVWLIYNNPVHRDIIERNFVKLKDYFYGGTEFITSFTNLETHMLMPHGDRDPICCVSAEFWAGFVNFTAKINLQKILVTRRINNLAAPDW